MLRRCIRASKVVHWGGWRWRFHNSTSVTVDSDDFVRDGKIAVPIREHKSRVTPMSADTNDHPIGKPIPRKEGRQKVTGQALYVDDLSFPNMLHGVTVRSSVPRGRIKNISFAGEIQWDEFTIVTAKDIPGENYVALILNDQPYLADEVT